MSIDFSLIDLNDISDEFSGGNLLIPEGTQLECVVVNAENVEANEFGNEKIRVVLEVTERGKYCGQTINHNLKIADDKESVQAKALRALATYDSLGKGYIVKCYNEGKEITDAVLQKSMIGVSVIATIGVYQLDNGQEGNWIMGFSGVKKQQSKPAPAQQKKQPAPEEPVAQKADDIEFEATDIEEDDDIPF